MGRIIIGTPAGRDGVRVSVAVDDVTASTRRAIELGGGTAEAASSGSSDVGEWTALIDPDGDRFGILHGRMRSRPHGGKRSGLHDSGLERRWEPHPVVGGHPRHRQALELTRRSSAVASARRARVDGHASNAEMRTTYFGLILGAFLSWGG
jgi:hypothetical protein